jgi:AcrR family transcriptional regulator
MENSDLETRDRIVASALELFARRGYAATSIQDIVSAANVTKPALYYYFDNKAALYQVLIDRVHEERFQLTQDAANRGRTVREKLVEIISSRFEYLKQNRHLMQIAYATAFASEEELPPEIRRIDKATRNFDFVHELIQDAQKSGELDIKHDSRELAFAIHGQMSIYIMNDLLQIESRLDHATAERIVDLFISGAGPGR